MRWQRRRARRGATIRTASPVKRITLEGDRVSGVELESGEKIAAGTVVVERRSCTTLLGLAGRAPPGNRFRPSRAALSATRAWRRAAPRARRPARLRAAAGRARGRAARDRAGPRLHSSMHSTRRSTASARRIPRSRSTIPSVHDKTLAPAGKHVLSAVVLYAPFDPRAKRRRCAARAPRAHARRPRAPCAPTCAGRSSRPELLLPADIEREFRITGGHWHHGELALDQFMMLRPVAGRRAVRDAGRRALSLRRGLPSGRRRDGLGRPQCRATRCLTTERAA